MQFDIQLPDAVHQSVKWCRNLQPTTLAHQHAWEFYCNRWKTTETPYVKQMERYRSRGLKWSLCPMTYSVADTFIERAAKCARCGKSEVIIVGSGSSCAVLRWYTAHVRSVYSHHYEFPLAPLLIVLLLNSLCRRSISLRGDRVGNKFPEPPIHSAWLQTVSCGARPADGAVRWAWLSKQHKHPSSLIPARGFNDGGFYRLIPIFLDEWILTYLGIGAWSWKHLTS